MGRVGSRLVRTRVRQEDRPEYGERAIPVPWTVRDAIGVLLTWWIIQIIASLAVPVLGLRIEDPSTLAALVVVPSLTFIAATLAWVGRKGPHALNRLIGQRRPLSSDVLAGIAYGIVGSIVITFGVGATLELLLRSLGLEVPDVQQALQDLVTGPAAPIAIVAIVCLAPIGEELLFRGMLFQALRQRFGFWPAALASGLVFGVIHGEPLVIFITAVFGVYLAWVFHHRGTLLVPIIVHALFNTLSVLLIRLGLG
jgi:membrane protease YdiL (CAAX protease family)